MRNKIRFLAFAGLFLLIAGALFAQTPRELRIGTQISGTLHEGDEQWFSIRPAQAGYLTVETFGDTDTYLEAYDASRNYIDEDDDGGESYNARLGIFVEANKTYLYKLRCYSEDESGPYRLLASFETITSRELRIGTAISGTLNEKESQWFSVRTAGAGFLTVETFGDTDTYLKVYDSSHKLIDEDDDGGEDYNAKIEINSEPNKTYLFRLSCFGSESGPYRILASFEAIPPDTARNTERSRAVPLKLGEAETVYFRSLDEARWYRFDVPRSNFQLVVQSRGNMDTYMVLYDAQGNIIEEDDDSGESLNAMISVRLNSGTVYIELNEYSGQTGRCTLHVDVR